MTAETIFNVADYGNDIQAALDDVSNLQTFGNRGGTVYIPRGEYNVDNPLLVRGGRIILRGENLDVLIRPANSGVPVMELEGDDSSDFGVHDFKGETFQIVGTAQTGNVGIECIGQGGYRPNGIRFENVFVSGVEKGVHMEDVDFPKFTRFGISEIDGDGAEFINCAAIAFYHSFIILCGAKGLIVDTALGFYYQGPGFELCDDWHVHLKHSQSCVIERCDFENYISGVLVEGCRAVRISDNVFLAKHDLAGAQVAGVLVRKGDPGDVTGGLSAGLTISGNSFAGGNDSGGNFPHVTCVKIEEGSCLDAFLHGNTVANTGSKRVRIYDVPPGHRSLGMNIAMFGGVTTTGQQEPVATQRGLRLPLISEQEFVRVDPANDGLLARLVFSHELVFNVEGRWTKLPLKMEP